MDRGCTWALSRVRVYTGCDRHNEGQEYKTGRERRNEEVYKRKACMEEIEKIGEIAFDTNDLLSHI